MTAATRDGELSHKQIMSIVSGLMIGMFLAALDQTIVTAAIRTIGDDLHGLSFQAWATTAFLVTSTISTPIFGKVSDMYGRKPLFMIAIVIFVGGSMLCGLSQSMYELAAFRAVQGIGAGGIMPLVLAIVGDIIPPRERARYQGWFMAVLGVCSVVGPVVGGLLAGQSSILGIAGWRWIFYVNVPLGALALVVIARVLTLTHTRREARIDWFGAATLAAGLVPLLVIAEQGRDWGWFSPGAWTCYAVGLVGALAFVRVEFAMGDDALLPMRLFRMRTFSAGSAQALVIGMGMLGALSAIPLYLQLVKSASPTQAGLELIPLVFGMTVGSLGVGRITARTGRYKIFPVIGALLISGGLLAMTSIGADTPLWRTGIYMVLVGLGLGMSMQTIVLAMQNAADARDMGVVTSAATFFRQIGGSLGAAIFLSILFTRAGSTVPHEVAKAGVDPSALKGFSINDTSALATLPAAVDHPILVGFSDAMDTVFLVGGLLTLLAFVFAALIKELPLRSASGARARVDEQAARDAVLEEAVPVPMQALPDVENAAARSSTR